MSKKFATKPHNNPKPKVKPQAKSPIANKPLDNAPAPAVESSQSPDTPAAQTTPDAPAAETPEASAQVQEHKNMDLTFTRSTAPRKDDRLVIFNFADGRPGSVQFLRTAFPKDIPNTITMSGDFAEKTERVAKVAETKEERKARLAALPKLTLAEKVDRAEKRTAALREKLAKSAPAAEGAAASM